MTTVLWQLEHDSARSYQEVLVPLLMGPAAGQVVRRAGIRPGASVLDVGCGTGAAAAAAVAEGAAQVVAADVNRHMLDVGRREVDDVEFWDADARALPFPDRSFDAVLCTHVLQFLPEPERAAAELARVARPGGTVAVSTWAGPDRLPYLSAVGAAVERQLGPGAGAPILAATSLGAPAVLVGLLGSAGLSDVTVDEEYVDVAVDDLASFIPRHLAATPVASAAAQAGPARIAQLTDDVLRSLGTDRGAPATLRFVQLVTLGHR